MRVISGSRRPHVFEPPIDVVSRYVWPRRRTIPATATDAAGNRTSAWRSSDLDTTRASTDR